jgi:integrase
MRRANRIAKDGRRAPHRAGGRRDRFRLARWRPIRLSLRDDRRALHADGQRRSEIGRLRWDYLDPETGSITLPAAETKNNRQHTFPLGATAAAIVRSIDRGTLYLFPARRDFRMDMPSAVYNSWAKDKRAFDQLCPIAHWTLHDLRRTFSTNLAGLNTSPHVLGRILNHSSGTISGVAAIYNRFRYMEEMRAAIEAWETKLARLVEIPSL